MCIRDSPAIMKKLMETNLEKTVGYGQDPYTEAVSYTHLDVYKRQVCDSCDHQFAGQCDV